MENKQYKKSNYNILVPYLNDETIVFNALTGSIGKFDKDTFNRFNSNTLTESEVEILKSKGILVPTSVNEIEMINKDRKDGIEDKKFKLYRIWPTSACNAQCYYCFEKGIKCNTMTTEIADKVVSFISNDLNDGDTLKIEWFGGEPLLNHKIIDYITSKILKICEEKNVKYFSSIISNGSLITEDIAKQMKEKWKIQLIQITLDGFKEEYNQSKNYKNPNLFNFDQVINCIRIIANQGIHVTIRMNYDTHNYESLVKLINYLKEQFGNYKNMSYYVYPLWSSIEEDVEDSFTSTAVADNQLLQLFDLLVKNNMGTISKIARLNYKKHACQAWSEKSLTILPDGNISKCCESYHEILGNVENGITNKDLHAFWINPNVDDKCVECVYLPLCQGGCKASKFSRMPQCFAYKPIFDDILKWYIRHLDEEVKKKTQQ